MSFFPLTVNCVLRKGTLCCLTGNIDNGPSITMLYHVLSNTLGQEQHRFQVYVHDSWGEKMREGKEEEEGGTGWIRELHIRSL